MADLLNTNPNDNYGDDAIVTLSPREHIRLRPGMYIGKLGDGAQADDGIYVLIKEVVDNSVDEFIMGAGNVRSTFRSTTTWFRCATTAAAFPCKLARGGRQRDEHRRQVRRLGLQEDRRPERRRRQGRQHAFERVHGPFSVRDGEARTVDLRRRDSSRAIRGRAA